MDLQPLVLDLSLLFVCVCVCETCGSANSLEFRLSGCNEIEGREGHAREQQFV